MPPCNGFTVCDENKFQFDSCVSEGEPWHFPVETVRLGKWWHHKDSELPEWRLEIQQFTFIFLSFALYFFLFFVLFLVYSLFEYLRSNSHLDFPFHRAGECPCHESVWTQGWDDITDLREGLGSGGSFSASLSVCRVQKMKGAFIWNCQSDLWDKKHDWQG